MTNKGLISFFILIQIVVFGCRAQIYDTLAAKKFIENYFSDVTNRNHIFIVDSCVNQLFWPREKLTIYNELKEYMSKEKLDSLFDICKNNASKFSWNSLQLDSIRIISNSESGSILSKGYMIHEKMYRRKLCNRRETIYPVRNHVYWFSCPVFFDGDYCLVYKGITSGLLDGSSCVLLYKKDTNNEWKIEKTVLCKIS